MDLQFEHQPLDTSRSLIMNSAGGGSGRALLGFTDIVRKRFAFLASYGFTEIEALPTIVRYSSGSLAVNVYHGRQSYEIGLQVGHGDEQYSMSELIRAADPIVGNSYRNPVATTADSVVSNIEWLAELLRRYGDRALRNDSDFFAGLKAQKKSWAIGYELDVLEAQIRPQAEAAFREGRFREAVQLYERIAVRLSPAEQAKLAAARKRS
jgi:hypothetical protein